MTLSEVCFMYINVFFWVLGLATLVAGGITYFETHKTDTWFDSLKLFGFCYLSFLVIFGSVHFAAIYLSYKSQTIVHINDSSVQKMFVESGLNCLLEPHESNHLIKTETMKIAVFKRNTLIFFNIDETHPKQSLQQLEKACLTDWAANKEQNFLNSVSKGGGK